MTPDQRHIINRCRKMLKLGFPLLEGKLIFRLIPEHRNVRVSFVDNNACGETGDVDINVESESAVDLRNGVAV